MRADQRRLPSADETTSTGRVIPPGQQLTSTRRDTSRLSRTVIAALAISALGVLAGPVAHATNPPAEQTQPHDGDKDTAQAAAVPGQVSGIITRIVSTPTGLVAEPAAGITVNAYWQQSHTTGVSRTITAVTDDQGRYTLKLPTYSQETGGHTFTGVDGQRIRVWPELSTLSENEHVVAAPGAGRLHDSAQATGAVWRDGEVSGLNFRLGSSEQHLSLPTPPIPVPEPQPGETPGETPVVPIPVTPTNVVSKVEGQVSWAIDSTGVKPAAGVKVVLRAKYLDAAQPAPVVDDTAAPGVDLQPPAVLEHVAEVQTDAQGRYTFDLPQAAALGAPGTSLQLSAFPEGRKPLESREVRLVDGVVTANVLLDSSVETTLSVIRGNQDSGDSGDGSSAAVTVRASGLPPTAGPYAVEFRTAEGTVLKRCDGLTSDNAGALPGCVADASVGAGSAHAVLRDKTGQIVAQKTLSSNDLRHNFDSTLPAGVVGTEYRTLDGAGVTLNATGGEAPYTYSLTGGPAGLHLDSQTGTLSGTPETTGDYTFEWTVQDKTGQSAHATVTVQIADKNRLIISQSPPIQHTRVGEQFSEPGPVVAGGSGARKYQASGLPPGLSADTATGAVTGMATEAGDYTVTWTITDSADNSVLATQMFRVEESAEPLVWTTRPIPALTVNEPVVGVAFTVTGGVQPYVYSAEGLPAGLKFDPATGVLSGSPTAAGSFVIKTHATDKAGHKVSADVTVQVAAADAAPNLTFPEPPKASHGLPFVLASPTLTGLKGPVVFTTKSLPQGLSLDALTGKIDGTPAESGTFAITVTAINGQGKTASTTLNLTVAPAAQELDITLDGQTDLKAGVEIAHQVNVTGGSGTYRFRVDSLPPGLTLDADTGAITGTPESTGDYPLKISVIDGQQRRGWLDITYRVAGNNRDLRATVSDSQRLTVTQGRETDVQLVTITGGQAPYAVSAQGLPAGLEMSADGRLTGTTNSAGAYPLTLAVKDSNGQETTATAILQIDKSAQQLVVGSKSKTTIAQVNKPYRGQLPAVSGGVAPLTFTSEDLPPGLTLDKTTGAVTGTPTKAGMYTYELKVTDSSNSQTSVTFSLAVKPANGQRLSVSGVPTELPLSPGEEASSAALTGLAINNAVGDLTCSASDLPQGLAVVARTGRFTGATTKVGKHDVSVSCEDEAQQKVDYQVSVNVKAPALAVPTTLNNVVSGTKVEAISFAVNNSPRGVQWKYTASGLPEGLTLDAQSGALSGTAPTTPGTHSVTVTATPSKPEAATTTPRVAEAATAAGNSMTAAQQPAVTWEPLTSTFSLTVVRETPATRTQTTVGMPTRSQNNASRPLMSYPTGPRRNQSSAPRRNNSSAVNSGAVNRRVNPQTARAAANLGYLAARSLNGSNLQTGAPTFQHLAKPQTNLIAVETTSGRGDAPFRQAPPNTFFSRFALPGEDFTTRWTVAPVRTLAPDATMVSAWLLLALGGGLWYYRRQQNRRLALAQHTRRK